MFSQFSKKFVRDIGIDLGTANTLVYVKDKGIVIDEPTVVAVNTKIDQIVAVGNEAKQMLGKTPSHIVVSRPLTHGVISDYEVAEKLLKFFIEKVYERGFPMFARPRVVIGVPLEVTEVETKAVEDVTLAAGASDVFVVQEPMAAAIGSRMPIEDPIGNMIVDIGGGLTQVAVISLSGVVTWKSSHLAGDEMNRNIIQYAREIFNLFIGETHAEQIKLRVGSALALGETIEFGMRGRDVMTGLPREVMVTDSHVREAIKRTTDAIVDLITLTLEITPPELIADIHERGILLTGGGSLLRGLDQVIALAADIPVRVADDPLTAVVRGAGALLEQASVLTAVQLPSARATRT